MTLYPGHVRGSNVIFSPSHMARVQSLTGETRTCYYVSMFPVCKAILLAHCVTSEGFFTSSKLPSIYVKLFVNTFSNIILGPPPMQLLTRITH